MVLHDMPGQLRAPKNTRWVDYVLLKPDAGSTVLVLSTPGLENLRNSIEKKGEAFALIFYTLQPNTSG